MARPGGARSGRSGEPLAGPTLARLGERRRGGSRVTLVAGSILERAERRRAPVQHQRRARPRRRACWRATARCTCSTCRSPARSRCASRRGAAAAPSVVCVDAGVGTPRAVGLLRPALPRALPRARARRAPSCSACPSAFTFPTGAAHWEVLLRARAIENQCCVLAPNQHGPTGLGHADYGHSMIVDPWGTVVACASDGERVITAEIDLGLLAKRAARDALPRARASALSARGSPWRTDGTCR